MRYYVFNSGSKGNCTLIVSKNHYLLIDLGISKKKLLEKLSEINISFSSIQAVLVTHSHSDHISGISAVDPSIVYTTKATFNEVYETHELIPYQSYQIAGFNVKVIPTSHDASGSIGFIIEDDNEKMVYITDTGYLYEKATLLIKNADYYIFESNHNIRMLLNTSRPQYLKQRILGDNGHLSNEDCALYLSDAIGNKTKEITLAHLSLEANTHEVAMETFLRIMKKKGLNLDGILIRCASQFDTLKGGMIEDKVNL